MENKPSFKINISDCGYKRVVPALGALGVKWLSGSAPSKFCPVDEKRDELYLFCDKGVLSFDLYFSVFRRCNLPEITVDELLKMAASKLSFKVWFNGNTKALNPALEALGIRWASGNKPSERIFNEGHVFLQCFNGKLIRSGFAHCFVESALKEITAEELYEMAGLVYPGNLNFKINLQGEKGAYDALVPALEALGVLWRDGSAPSDAIGHRYVYLYCENGRLSWGNNRENFCLSKLEEITVKQLFEMADLPFEEVAKESAEENVEEDGFSFLEWYYKEVKKNHKTIYRYFGTVELEDILLRFSKEEILKKLTEAKKPFCLGDGVILSDDKKGFVMSVTDEKLGVVTNEGFVEVEKEDVIKDGRFVENVYHTLETSLIHF